MRFTSTPHQHRTRKTAFAIIRVQSRAHGGIAQHRLNQKFLFWALHAPSMRFRQRLSGMDLVSCMAKVEASHSPPSFSDIMIRNHARNKTDMHLNLDFSQRAVVRFDDVQRRMLDRIGGEVACATSIVRFKPGSAFSPHTHVGGEEYPVLDDTSQNEDGELPIGIYERSSSTSSQTPAGLEGARVWIKTRHLRLIGEAPA